MNKEILKQEGREYEDEIDLVDLIKVLLRNKVLIMTTFFIVMVISGIGSYVANKKTKENIKYKGKLIFMYKPNELKTKDDVDIYSTEINLLKALLGTRESYKYTITSVKDSDKIVEDDLAVKYKEIIKKSESIGLEEKKFVLLTTDIKREEKKSKSRMIVRRGLILGLFFGVFIAFVKEFLGKVDWKN
jgi:LPS O-antigen subunit length determinant protein (WzzB/FepE family)